ncbi:MAG TPA: FAD binding domain-containing protein [Ramlibacter sp.]|nr:FAD binding domain-containing protein [Ramlibacter sp.]
MNLWQNYVRPASLAEAVTALTSSPGPAIPLAGGTDLLLDLEQGRHSPVRTVVDVTCIPEMQAVELRGERLFIGAAVPLSRVARHPLVQSDAQALVEACDLVGGPQVRNVATLGGNVAHALPAADGTIALLALDAQAEIAGPSGLRCVALADLFLGPGKSSLKRGEELLAGFYIRLRPRTATASAFRRIMRPQGVALPILNVAAWVRRTGKLVQGVHIAVGPGSSTPFRARSAEAVLNGMRFGDEALAAALQALLDELKFRSSARRASADYRRHLVTSLFRDTLEAAWERCQ